MTLRGYDPSDLPAIVALWNEALSGTPNFIPLQPSDFEARVTRQPSFEPDMLLVGEDRDGLCGFVHVGLRSNLWFELAERRVDASEGHVYAIVARPGDRGAIRAMLEAGLQRLRQLGAGRALLSPSWIHGTQPFYNGIAGAYEMPGLSAARQDVLEEAVAMGFRQTAEYGTPELDFARQDHVSSLLETGEQLSRGPGWGLRQSVRTVRRGFFPPRRVVVLTRRFATVATTCYALWDEYARAHGRRLFGITGVRVAPEWRGKGLGKLVMIRAMEAAAQEGAEGLHLHVYKGNAAAWNLYHRALGFQPRATWVTLEKDLRP